MDRDEGEASENKGVSRRRLHGVHRHVVICTQLVQVIYTLG